MTATPAPAAADSPSWESSVQSLFTSPSWIAADRRRSVAAVWQSCMVGYQLDLSDYDSVRQSARTIYEHLVTRAMPLTTDPTQYWPPEALEVLRQWIGAGCPRRPGDPIRNDPMPLAPASARRVKVRRNILDLDEAELAAYRARLEELGATTVDPNCTWQRVAYIHTDWCLHYQEAFLLWHRANLLYFEHLLGLPIPYWNFMSPEVSRDGSREGGIPQAFKDLTYIHPHTGEERSNPLRFAVAKDARSKVCAAGSAPPPGVDCRYIQRDPVLYTSGDDQREQRIAKLGLLEHFQAQVAFAQSWGVFSSPEGAPGYPWANILTFDPPPPDSDYPHRTDFDGLFEQPHDNFHGWIGPDMADNAYTGFDPIFWSYHANVDRVFEEWNRAHPAAMFTTTYPLRPFVGNSADQIDPSASDSWRFTTIGDMARDSRALGYDYEAPTVADSHGAPPVGLAPDVPATAHRLYVLFPGVRCTLETYIVDVFVDLDNPTPVDVGGPHYVGRMTRLGMGIEDDKGRCVTRGVTRVMDATHNAQALGLEPGSPVTVGLLVHHAHTDAVVAPSDYLQQPGFTPTATWGGPMPTTASNPREGTDSCH